MSKHTRHIIILILLSIIACVAIFFIFRVVEFPFNEPVYDISPVPFGPYLPKPSEKEKIKAISLPTFVAPIEKISVPSFAYAHGTVMAHDKIYIGMADNSGNPFPTNQIQIFFDLNDLNKQVIIPIPIEGDISSMIYDSLRDKIYFNLSKSSTLSVLRIDPRSYMMTILLSTTSIASGRRPAITTDGKYVYGITNTDPSKIFKIDLDSRRVEVSTTTGHIVNGHSATIGVYASSTELYFANNTFDQFEKVDANTLRTLATTTLPQCAITDDMPYLAQGDNWGYVYLGCEKEPFGYRIKTNDLTYDPFLLPGNSYGMFIYGNNLYNAAHDGYFDLFPNFDIHDIHRFSTEKNIQVNELFFSSSTQRMFLTGWWGEKGLLETRPITI